MSSYRNYIFENYHNLHGRHLDGLDNEKISWFRSYANQNYKHLLKKNINSDSSILEIGCNKGYLLHILTDYGYKNVTGIDLSGDDIERAKLIAPFAKVECTSAEEHLTKHKGGYELIILKAVLEHVEKNNILKFLELIKEALCDGGMIIIDVPNMDWLFATHERYMDFTHECGFTSESLMQVMRVYFSDSHVIPISSPAVGSVLRRFSGLVAKKIITGLLKTADSEGGQLPIFSRSILGIGYRKA